MEAAVGEVEVLEVPAMMRTLGLLSCASMAMAFPNMNLQDYVISPTPGTKRPGVYNTKWSEYPNGVESFDVYMGPITHHYGEVFWTSLPEVPLPPDLVKRFEGKGMAIMGYEVDQVRKKGDKDFDGSILKEDVSVPINMAYNHHHDATVLGKGSRMEKVRYDPNDLTVPSMMRSDPNFITVPVSHTPSELGIPTHAHLAAGNGGEYRGSYHGFASPVAYVIDSPSSVHVLPMQIDTWNRDEMSPHGNGTSKFVPGPLPKHALSPRGLDALYSGLLECPLTDKIIKNIQGGDDYNDTFGAEIFQCPANGSRPLTDQHLQGYKSGPMPSWPARVYPLGSPATDTEELNLFWNEKLGDHWTTFGAKQAANATANGYELVRKIGLAPTAASKASKKPIYLHYSPSRHDHFSSFTAAPPGGYTALGVQGYILDRSGAGLVELSWFWSPEGNGVTQTRGDNALAQHDGSEVRTQCEHVIATAEQCFEAAKAMDSIGKGATVQTSQGASDAHAPGCTVTYAAGGVVKVYFNTKATDKCCGDGVTALEGKVQSLVDLELTTSKDSVTITLTGPSTVWFGVGFNAQAMVEQPYSIIVDGKGAVTERKMANHAAGLNLSTTVTVVSNTVASGRRTVVLTRAAKGATKDHTTFTMQDLRIPFISAVGSTPDLSYHKNKTASVLSLWPSADQAVCMCSYPAAAFGHAQGTIKYAPTGEEFGFVNYCDPEPRESVLAQRNPTCDVRAYVGGLQVCKHMWSLLDSDQEKDPRVQRWRSTPLTYYQKYRFYYQDYIPDHHIISVPRQGWGIAAAGGNAEYDVPAQGPNTTWEIWGVLTPGGDDLHLAAIHFHCHAPTCLQMAIYNNVTGDLVCAQNPIYGGTGKISEPKFDEPGYILQPPCLWGDQPGLEPMPKASGVKFLIKAITNSTYGHHGEMAFPEVTLVPWKNTSAFAQP